MSCFTQAVALRGASPNVLPCLFISASLPPSLYPSWWHLYNKHKYKHKHKYKYTNTQIPTNTQIWITQRLHLFVHLRPSHRHYPPPDDTSHYNHWETVQPQIWVALILHWCTCNVLTDVFTASSWNKYGIHLLPCVVVSLLPINCCLLCYLSGQYSACWQACWYEASMLVWG